MRIAIFGGAGFIGSLIAKECVNRGYETTVIDGLLPQTGGREENLNSVVNKIHFIPKKIEDIKNLDDILIQSDVSICAMAWTSHLKAMQNPEYDIELNLLSHVRLLSEAPAGVKLIYIGSRGQYGSATGTVGEDTPMLPVDVQGINKTAAESYYRVYSKIKGLKTISLRLPNCFGINQPVKGEDIGLIGGMTRDLLENKIVKVYGTNRMRNFLYGDDCARIVCDIINSDFDEFTAYNVAGTYVSIINLAQKLATIIGTGNYETEEISYEIKHIDAGNAKLDENLLKKKIGIINYTDFDVAIQKTVEYFKKETGL
jgi:UDP-glucose 4-epimerase